MQKELGGPSGEAAGQGGGHQGSAATVDAASRAGAVVGAS